MICTVISFVFELHIETYKWLLKESVSLIEEYVDLLQTGEVLPMVLPTEPRPHPQIQALRELLQVLGIESPSEDEGLAETDHAAQEEAAQGDHVDASRGVHAPQDAADHADGIEAHPEASSDGHADTISSVDAPPHEASREGGTDTASSFNPPPVEAASSGHADTPYRVSAIHERARTRALIDPSRGPFKPQEGAARGHRVGVTPRLYSISEAIRLIYRTETRVDTTRRFYAIQEAAGAGAVQGHPRPQGGTAGPSSSSTPMQEASASGQGGSSATPADAEASSSSGRKKRPKKKKGKRS
ncbi:hypothetical protein B0O80DRAFT_504092 [Mortierella sp. GBAus27b]|nr:hypothetical protein BGX31_010036 [Mortierella sp. GBA43]KAI8345746.1 hypothetical protein B0O80DRAFT_504092 [Mortierella sp. GBAus27b]